MRACAAVSSTAAMSSGSIIATNSLPRSTRSGTTRRRTATSGGMRADASSVDSGTASAHSMPNSLHRSRSDASPPIDANAAASRPAAGSGIPCTSWSIETRFTLVWLTVVHPDPCRRSAWCRPWRVGRGASHSRQRSGLPNQYPLWLRRAPF